MQTPSALPRVREKKKEAAGAKEVYHRCRPPPLSSSLQPGKNAAQR